MLDRKKFQEIIQKAPRGKYRAKVSNLFNQLKLLDDEEKQLHKEQVRASLRVIQGGKND